MMLCVPKALQSIGGFDENYFLFFEGFYLSLRLKTEGDIYLVPKMQLHLFGENTSSEGLNIVSFIKFAYFLTYPDGNFFEGKNNGNLTNMYIRQKFHPLQDTLSLAMGYVFSNDFMIFNEFTS